MTFKQHSKRVAAFENNNSIQSFEVIDTDAQFSMYGCEICCTGGNNVYEVHAHGPKDATYHVEMCGICLDLAVNGASDDR